MAATNQDITWFLDLHDRDQLDLDPPYQRRSVWSAKDKRFFIDTIFNDYPAPPVFLHKTLDVNGRPTYHVVDGKQRIETIIQFRQNKIYIPEDFSNVTLQRKKWSDLERSSHEIFWNYSMSVVFLPDVSDAFLRNIFDRINRNSRRLMPQEMRHAKYEGWFIEKVEAEAEKQDWKEFGISTTARVKRMADVQFISELFGIVINKKMEGFDQETLNDLYAYYEDISDSSTLVEDDFLQEIERIKSYIRESMLLQPEVSNYLKIQSHFYTLWAYVALKLEDLLKPQEFASKYAKFLTDVNLYSADGGFLTDNTSNYSQEVITYFSNLRGANTDLTPRTARFDALVQAIHG